MRWRTQRAILCETVFTSDSYWARQRGLTYRKVDIQSSPELFARFRYRIPVIEIDGGATLDWPVSGEQVWTAVRAAARP